MKRAIVFIVFFIAGLLIVKSIFKEDKDGEKTAGHGFQILRFNNMSEPQGLDPHASTGIPETHIIDALYEGLVRLDTQTLEPIPGMAESWSLSPDGRTYTFKIRRASWSNGDPFTAQDFVDSWQRMLRLDPVSEYVSMLYIVENARDYADKIHDDFSKVQVKAPDARTFVVTLKAPTPYFLEALAHHSFFPVHRASDSFKVDAEKQKPGNLIGNGPFVLKEHYINEKLYVTKNENYWDKDNVHLDGIEYYPIDNIDTALLMFQNGELDYLDEVPLTSLHRMIKDKNPDLRITPYFGVYYYRFNTTLKPFNDVRVRQAFCMAIDKKRITGKVTAVGEIPTNSMVPTELGDFTPASLKSYQKSQGIGYNPAKARQLLKEAGYPKGQGFPVVEILYNNNENHKKIALEVSQMLKLNLGVEVTLLNKEWKVYLNDMSKLNYTIARSGWIGDYSDPMTFLEIFKTGDGNNRTGWSNREYDLLIAEASLTADTNKRLDILHQAEKILVNEEVPIIPIYIYVNKAMISPRVTGWKANVRNIISWKDLALTQ